MIRIRVTRFPWSVVRRPWSVVRPPFQFLFTQIHAPVIAKAYQIPYLNIATKVMLGEKRIRDFKYVKRLKGYAIKEPVFSFEKFPGVSKELGPEMKSTGEAIRFIKDLKDPYFRQLYKDRSMYLSK